MTELQGCFTPNWEDVAANVIDGELTAIRLSDGTYYSMDDVGTRVWELIDGGHDLLAVTRTIATSYAVAVEQVASDVRALVQELLAEELIRPAGDAGRPQATEAPIGEPAPYHSPQLHIYRDMGNLLALDPPTPGIDDLLFKEGNPE